MSLTTVDSGLISSGAITLTTQVTGTLPVANGGSGVTTSTGTGANVLGTSPTLVTPLLGTPTSGSLVNCADLNYTGFKNRIINGGMVIDQRNAGALVSPAVNATYYLDRWYAGSGAAGKFSIQQTPSATETGYAVRVAAGFTSYLACTSLSAYTAGASEQFVIRQAIEGLNISDLAWGTASAKTITISALVYSSLTGTFGGSLYNNAGDRSYPFTYSIPVANTWTTISVTIAGDTSGTWLTTNSVGIYVGFAIGAGATVSGTAGAWSSTLYRSATGATSVVGTSGATFYITGVQLEKGSAATSFDYRPYGTELQLCQRYYQTSYPSGVVANGVTTITDGVTWVCINSSDTSNGGSYPITMRTTPTFTAYYPGGGSGVNSARDNDAGAAVTGLNYYGGTAQTLPRLNKSAGLTARANTLAAQYTASAEL